MLPKFLDHNNRELKQRERQTAMGLDSKTTTLHVYHAFLFISQPSQHDVKRSNFMRPLYKLGEHNANFFLNLNTVLSDLTPENVANI